MRFAVGWLACVLAHCVVGPARPKSMQGNVVCANSKPCGR